MNKFISFVFFIIIFSLFSHLGSCIPVDISSPSSFSSPNDLTTEVTSSSQSPSSSTSSHHSSSSSISSHERTLLITQKWLIDNINLLRREMSEMARDYNLHIDANKQEANRKETEFARDVDSLRADHTLLARNQLKIINLIKSSNQGQHGSTSETNSNENNIQNENTIHETSTSENTEHSHKSRKNLRHLVYDLMKVEANFEHETKHNLSSVSSQLAALHEITLSLYQDLKDLKSKIRSVDFDQL